MDMESLLETMDQFLKENGEKINNMERVKKYGQMGLLMRVIITMD